MLVIYSYSVNSRLNKLYICMYVCMTERGLIERENKVITINLSSFFVLINYFRYKTKLKIRSPKGYKLYTFNSVILYIIGVFCN